MLEGLLQMLNCRFAVVGCRVHAGKVVPGQRKAGFGAAGKTIHPFVQELSGLFIAMLMSQGDPQALKSGESVGMSRSQDALLDFQSLPRQFLRFRVTPLPDKCRRKVRLRS